VKRKLLALLLFVLGTLWVLAFAWFYLVMSAITEPVLPLPIHLFLGFIGPALLILGSLLAIADWHSRFGAICCIIACGLLTWFLGGDILETYLQPVLHPNNAIRSPYTLGTSVAVALEGASFVIADIAAIALLRTVFRHARRPHVTAN
jgi:hypothetical protein